MNPGRLRHRVEIQQPIKTADGMGGFTEGWSSMAIRQAAIWNLKGKEKVIDGKLTEETIWNIRIRYLEGIGSGMRVVYGNTVFEILAVAPFEFRKIYQDLSCRLHDGRQL